MTIFEFAMKFAMARRHQTAFFLIFGLVLSNFVSTFGKLECEDLPVEDCAFSVASSGTRCVLEKYKGKDNSIQYECQSSIIMAEKQEEWIESDECVKSCGLERMSVGLSTDLLMDSGFTGMLCSSECLNNCPNLIDLYISLAAGEGVYLPQLCKTHRMSSRRVIADPVKKASDAEYERSQQLFPSLAMAPAGAQSGADTPPTDTSSRPDYRGYVAGGEALTPMSPPALPVSSSTTPPAPVAQTPTLSATKRPFFVASSPPTPAATPPSTTEQSPPVSAPAVNPPPESSPLFSASGPSLAPEASYDLGSDDYLWQQQTTENLMPNRRGVSLLNDEEYLYETYFH